MSESLTPELRLRTRVEAILDRASVASAERADLAEEMYGHLWQRWQDGLAAVTPEASLDRAIEAFGDPSTLGRDITGAYHSRLYASTIGVLLPSIAVASPEKPGWGPFLLRVFLVGILLQDVAMAAWALQTLTPGRLAITLAGLTLSAFTAVLALRAFGRAQRWALRLARLALAISILGGMVELMAGPGLQVNPLAVVALLAAPAAIGPGLEAWVAHSRPIRRRLGIPLAAMLVGGFLMPPLALALPDPTQVGPADLSIGVTATCGTDSQGDTTVTVEARIRWDRLDQWPSGLLNLKSADPYTSTPGQEAYDGLVATVMASPDQDVSSYVGTTVDVDQIPQPYLSEGEPTVVGPDSSTVQDWIRGSTYWTGGGGWIAGYTFPQTGLSPGKFYTVRWVFSPSPWNGNQPLTSASQHPAMAVVSYSHLDRFLVQGVATCSTPGVGVQVAPLVQ
jgi:hypothetical protein